MGSWWSEAALTRHSNPPKCTLAPHFLPSSLCAPQLVHAPLSGCAGRCGCLPPEKGVWQGRQAPPSLHTQPPLPCTHGFHISHWDELEKPSDISQESCKRAPDFQRTFTSALWNLTTLNLMNNHSSAFWRGVTKSPRSPVRELRSTVQGCLLLYLVLPFFQMEECLHTKYRIFRVDQTFLSDVEPTTQPFKTIGPLFSRWRRVLCRRTMQPHPSKT